MPTIPSSASSSSRAATDSASPGTPRSYTPRAFLPKLLFLIFGLLVFAFGAAFLWEPLGRMIYGHSVEARVAEIRVVEPGQPDRVYKYRREYAPERNLAITFQHHVAIEIEGRTVLHRISVDSRKAPIPSYNVNDVVPVAYYADDPRRLAFAYRDARTWGAGGLFCGLGLAILGTAIPMLLAVGRPILIDAEASEQTPSS